MAELDNGFEHLISDPPLIPKSNRCNNRVLFCTYLSDVGAINQFERSRKISHATNTSISDVQNRPHSNPRSIDRLLRCARDTRLLPPQTGHAFATTLPTTPDALQCGQSTRPEPFMSLTINYAPASMLPRRATRPETSSGRLTDDNDLLWEVSSKTFSVVRAQLLARSNLCPSAPLHITCTWN